MLRRSLPIFLLLLLAPALPASAGASIQQFGTLSAGPDSLSPRQTLRKAEAVAAGRGGAGGRELTPLLKELAVKLPALGAGDRRRARGLLARPTLGEAAGNEQSYTVAEQTPLCSTHFCIHWVGTTNDAPPLTRSNGNLWPDYVESMDTIFEHVYDVENSQLGWRAPKPDGAKGCPGAAASCMNRTDVYIADLGGQGIYGYSAPDPGQGQSLSQHAYLVMDNDYSAQQFPRYGGDPTQPAEVTAAHEYNHVLQFAYDLAQDTWMFEATAVWMEDKVYTEVNDYLQYLTPWAQMTFVPLTQFNVQRSDDPANVKVYGDAVWNRWLDAKFGQDTPRIAWEHSLTSKPKSFAPGAYDQALALHGSSFFSSFTQFAADTAEWQTPSSPFAEGNTFPDMQRVRDSTTGSVIKMKANSGGAGGRLDHTTFGLLDVTPLAGASRVKLVLTAPRGVQMALALVGRDDDAGGTTTTVLTRLPKGGPGTVTLPDPGRFSRITAVLINGDGRTTGRFSQTFQDWQWVGDGASVVARVSTDYTPPSVRRRSPGAGQRGFARRGRVQIQFSERMVNVGTRTVLLIGPGHHKVKAGVTLTSGRKLVITPRKPLRAGARYTVRLSRDIADLGGNDLPNASRTWSFRTGR
ncbi:MAG: hypothetical protein QOF37_1256 [Thermoleophilaceae bacterium]|nr:hypothetical protein [Thermoleophilaceae bacterium]